MTRYLPFLTLFLLLASCHRNRVVIRGTLENGSAIPVVLEEMDIESVRSVDSVVTGRNGKFVFRYDTKQPRFLYLKINGHAPVTLLAKPGENIVFHASADRLPGEYQVTGSPGSVLVQELDQQLRKTIGTLDSLQTLYDSLAANPAPAGRLEELEAEYAQVIKNQRQYSIRFIMQHTGSLASYMAMYQKLNPETYVLNTTFDLQYMKILSDSLGKYFPRSAYVRALKSDLETEMAQYRSEQMKRLIENMEATPFDVALPNLEGDTVPLSSLQGHYTLLNFWSTAHAESMQENRYINRLFQKYAPSGFRVYQVALDTNQTLVKRIMEYEDYSWIQVIDTEMERSRTALLLNVRDLPANFLINPKGEFIARDLYGDALRQKLSQIYD